MLLVAFKPLELLVRILAHFRIVGFAGWESIRSYLYEPPPSSLLEETGYFEEKGRSPDGKVRGIMHEPQTPPPPAAS